MSDSTSSRSSRFALATLASLFILIPFGAATFGKLPDDGRLVALTVVVWVTLPARLSLVTLVTMVVRTVRRSPQGHPPMPLRVHLVAGAAAAMFFIAINFESVEYVGVFVPFGVLVASCAINNWAGSAAREVGAITLRNTATMRLFRPTSDSLAGLLNVDEEELAGVIFGDGTLREAAAILYVVSFFFGGAAAAAGVPVPSVPAVSSQATTSPGEADVDSGLATATASAERIEIPSAPTTLETTSPVTTTTATKVESATCVESLSTSLSGAGLSTPTVGLVLDVIEEVGHDNTGCGVASAVGSNSFQLVALDGGEGFAVLVERSQRAVLIYPHAVDGVRAAIEDPATASIDGQYANTRAGSNDEHRRSFIYVVNRRDGGCQVLHRNVDEPSFRSIPVGLSDDLLLAITRGYVQIVDGVDDELTVRTYAPNSSRAIASNTLSDANSDDRCDNRTGLSRNYPDGPQFMSMAASQ